MNTRVFILVAFCITLSKCELEKVPQPPIMLTQSNGSITFERWEYEYNKRLIFECVAEGYPEPDYTWERHNRIFAWMPAGKGGMSLTDPTPGESGDYECCASNIYGKACYNQSVNIVVYERLTNSGVPELIDAKLGEPLKLTYKDMPRSFKQSNFFWIIQTKINSIRKIDNPRITPDDKGNLWFSNITYDDLIKDELYTLAVATKDSIQYVKQFKLIIDETEEPANSYVVHQYTSDYFKVALVGDNIDLYCIYGGTPLPEVSWFKNDNPLKFNDRISLNKYGKMVTLKNVTHDDKGKYTCTAKNGNNLENEESKSISLVVYSKPSVKTEVEKVLISEDETVELKCEVDGIPTPNVKWTYNGETIHFGSNTNLGKVGNNMVIHNARKSNTAVYSCVAKNAIGVARKNIALTVFNAPPAIKNIEDDLVLAKQGETVLIDCEVSGTPTPKITWSHKGQPLIYNQLTSAKTNSHFTIFSNGSLEVQNLSVDDEGEYICEAVNKLGSVRKSKTIRTMEQKKIINVIDPFSVKVSIGSTFTLKCNLEANIKTDEPIKWYENGSLLRPSDDYIMNGDLLTITRGSAEYSSNYSCIVPFNNVRSELPVTFVNTGKLLSSKHGKNLRVSFNGSGVLY